MQLEIRSPATRAITSLESLLPQAWLGGCILLLVTLVARRTSGDLLTPLTFDLAGGFGLFFALHSWFLRDTLRQRGWFGLSPLEFDQKVSLGTWLLLIVLVVPGTGNLTWMMLCFPWAATELYWWCVQREEIERLQSARLHGSSLLHPAHHGSAGEITGEDETCNEDDDAEADGADPVEGEVIASQKFIDSPQHQLIQGRIQIRFQSQELTAVVHIPFYPALASNPEFLAEIVGNHCQIRVTEARPYGARLEVKRPAATTTARDIFLLNYEALVEKEIA